MILRQERERVLFAGIVKSAERVLLSLSLSYCAIILYALFSHSVSYINEGSHGLIYDYSDIIVLKNQSKCNDFRPQLSMLLGIGQKTVKTG